MVNQSIGKRDILGNDLKILLIHINIEILNHSIGTRDSMD
jgi:hypothetical protein